MSERALVIVPTYNERENIAEITRQILDQGPMFDILIVDDGSPDGTGELADELAASEPRITVLHRRDKRGLGTAYLAGFEVALERGFDFAFEMDADFSHDPKYLVPMLQRAQRGADMVVGSRYIVGGGTVNWGIGRQLVSRFGGLYARTILGLPIRDLTSGFICYQRRALESVDLDAVASNGYSFQIEMKYRVSQAGLRIEEMPIVFEDRRVGQSKMSSSIAAEALWMVWKLRLRR